MLNNPWNKMKKHFLRHLHSSNISCFWLKINENKGSLVKTLAKS